MTERPGDGDEPTNDTSRQPWLHELSIVVRGNVTAVSGPGGDIRAVAGTVTRPSGGTAVDASDGARGAADGLYVDERRVVSVFTVSLGDEPLVPVASSDRASVGVYLSSARHLGDSLPDPTVEVRRTRTVRPGGMDEDILVTSRAVRQIRAQLSIDIGGDGAEITDVKQGRVAGMLLPADVPAGNVLAWGDARHDTRVTLLPAPDVLRPGTADRPSCASYLIDLRQGESCTVRVRVQTMRRLPSAFDADAGADVISWDDVAVTDADPRLGRAVQIGLEDLRALLMVDPRSDPHAPDAFAAAGAPWFLTLFGRDSIWTARLTLPFGTDLARGTLRALARRIADQHDPAVSAAPGKVLHEIRRMRTDPGGDRSRAAVYYGSVDATPLWICLLHDAWRWGMAEEHVAGLLPTLCRTISWLTEDSEDGSGLLRYLDASGSGLVNQGWKDSGDSMRDRFGRVARTPIALVEVQGYAVEAAYSAAALADAFGLENAAALRGWGDDLARRIRDRFWVDGPGGRYLAMALDADGAPVDGVGSNMGHLLGTGALTPAESAEVARMIAGPSLLGPFGVATLSRDNPAYNPIGYHTGSVWTHDTAICCWSLVRAGYRAEARRVAGALLDAMEAFDYHCPELYAGEALLGRPVPYPASCHPQAWAAAAAAVLVTERLGVRADVPGGTVHLAPPGAAAPGPLSVVGLRVAETPMSVTVAVDGTVTTRVAAPGLEVRTW